MKSKQEWQSNFFTWSHLILAAHIDDLKANDNMKFSQEYESIEPGTTKLGKRYNKTRVVLDRFQTLYSGGIRSPVFSYQHIALD